MSGDSTRRHGGRPKLLRDPSGRPSATVCGTAPAGQSFTDDNYRLSPHSPQGSGTPGSPTPNANVPKPPTTTKAPTIIGHYHREVGLSRVDGAGC